MSYRPALRFLGVLFALAAPLLHTQAPPATGPSFDELLQQAQAGNAEAQYQVGRRYTRGDGTPANIPEGLKWFRAAVAQNHPGGFVGLGVMLLHGNGLPQDTVEGLRLIRLSAEKGHPRGLAWLGNVYSGGLGGVKPDPVEAAKWYRRGAEKNDYEALYHLGRCYEEGIGVPKSASEAQRLYRLSAEQNYADAQVRVGVAYHAAKNYREAVKWYALAAKQGKSHAQYFLGRIYIYGAEGVAKNPPEGLQLLKLAAAQNHVGAQRSLGALYKDGGVVAIDRDEAKKWFLLAAQNGDATSQFEYGFMIDVGAKRPEAMEWYRKAAAQGNGTAAFWLAMRYNLGSDPIAEDQVEATKWFQRGAELGHAVSQRNLATRYALGQGVAQSDEQARYWYRKAAEQGEPFSMYYTGVTMETNDVMRLELEAIDLLRKAANHQVREATLPLAARLIYFGGTMDFARTGGGTRGTKEQGLPYLMEGHMWLRIAALRPGNIESDHESLKKMTNLPDTLTPAQRAEVERRVQEWLANHPEKKP